MFNNTLNPGFLRDVLPDKAPEEEEKNFSNILQQTKKHILPNMTKWQHSKFFAYFPASLHYSSIIGGFMDLCFAAPAFTWYASPAITELENLVSDWLC